jgi:hypothetical protein
MTKLKAVSTDSRGHTHTFRVTGKRWKLTGESLTGRSTLLLEGE